MFVGACINELPLSTSTKETTSEILNGEEFNYSVFIEQVYIEQLFIEKSKDIKLEIEQELEFNLYILY
jgi:hypothetical protein